MAMATAMVIATAMAMATAAAKARAMATAMAKARAMAVEAPIAAIKKLTRLARLAGTKAPRLEQERVQQTFIDVLQLHLPQRTRSDSKMLAYSLLAIFDV